MKAVSQSSFSPFSDSEAAIGMVPYMQSGETMPRMLAGITPKAPKRAPCIAPSRPCILSFAKTEISEPRRMPSAQKGAISLKSAAK